MTVIRGVIGDHTLKDNNGASLGHYLQKLDQNPLLTKKEEEELVRNIEKSQTKI